MRGEEDDLFLCRAQDAAKGRIAVPLVKARERLVERERIAGREQRAGKREPPLHAAGIAAHPFLSHAVKAQLRKQRRRARIIIVRAEREAEVARGVQLRQQPVLLKDRRPAEVLRRDRAAVRPLQAQQNAQERRFADARIAHDAREPHGRGEGQPAKHRPAVIGFLKVRHAKLHHAPTLSVILSTARRKSRSKPADSSTMTAVHAKRSGVSK